MMTSEIQLFLALADYKKKHILGQEFDYQNQSRKFLKLVQGKKFEWIDKDELNKDLVIHAINSSKKNTKLKINLMYDGKDREFLNIIEGKNVNLIKTASSLKKFWLKKDVSTRCVANGAFLRMEIPRICEEQNIGDEFVLYTDIDVLFLKQPEVEIYKPEFFAVSTQESLDLPYDVRYAEMNSGVMWLNVRNMKDTFQEFKEHLRISDYMPNGYDQPILRKTYKNLWDYLPEKLNWKPRYGKPNEDTEIIHFHGPKPSHLEKIIEEVKIPEKIYLNFLPNENMIETCSEYLKLYKRYD